MHLPLTSVYLFERGMNLLKSRLQMMCFFLWHCGSELLRATISIPGACSSTVSFVSSVQDWFDLVPWQVSDSHVNRHKWCNPDWKVVLKCKLVGSTSITECVRGECFKCKYSAENVLQYIQETVTSYVTGSYLSSLLCKLLLCDFTTQVTVRRALTFTVPTSWALRKKSIQICPKQRLSLTVWSYIYKLCTWQVCC